MAKMKTQAPVRTFKKQKKWFDFKQTAMLPKIDETFIQIIAPIGGIAYHPEFIRKGDGYECSVYVYEFTETVRPGWLNRFKLENVVVSFSVYSQEKEVIEDKIEKSIDEQLSRQHDPKTATLDVIKSKRQVGELTELVEDIDGNGEVVFKVAIRLLLAERTFVKLEEKLDKVLSTLRGYSYGATVLTNEQPNEFNSLFRLADKDIIYRRHGVAMPAETFGAGFPFSFSSLDDDRGIFLGTTDDGGAMVLDTTERTGKRANYNGCLIGLQRSGKSTLIKKLIKNFVILGHRVRMLDPVGETVPLAEMLGGQIVSLDGKTDVLNPLDYRHSIATSLAKAETFLSYLIPDLDHHEVAIFNKILKMIYDQYVPQKKQPLLSDVLKVLKNILKKQDLSVNRRTQYENLETQLEYIIESYGTLFNRQSSIDTYREDLVIYTLRELSSYSANVFQAQMFNIIALQWQEMIVFGAPEKQAYEEGKKGIEDVCFTLLCADEAHHFLGANNRKGLEFLVMLEREAPKYFGAFIWATHSIKDAVSNQNSETAELVEKLFEFCQYKFILKQDANAVWLCAVTLTANEL